MGADTIFSNIDVVEKELWDKIVRTANKYDEIDYSPYEVSAALVLDIETATATVTLNKKAPELYDAISAGRMVKISFTSMNGEPVSGVELLVPMFATKEGPAGSIVYGFSYTNESGEYFYGEHLSATDDVVFTATVEIT